MWFSKYKYSAKKTKTLLAQAYYLLGYDKLKSYFDPETFSIIVFMDKLAAIKEIDIDLVEYDGLYETHRLWLFTADYTYNEFVEPASFNKNADFAIPSIMRILDQIVVDMNIEKSLQRIAANNAINAACDKQEKTCKHFENKFAIRGI